MDLPASPMDLAEPHRDPWTPIKDPWTPIKDPWTPIKDPWTHIRNPPVYILPGTTLLFQSLLSLCDRHCLLFLCGSVSSLLSDEQWEKDFSDYIVLGIHEE